MMAIAEVSKESGGNLDWFKADSSVPNGKLKHRVIAPNTAPGVEIQLLEVEKLKAKKTNSSLEPLPDTLIVDKEPTPKEVLEVHVMRKMIKKYFDVATIRIIDVIPKMIMSFLVHSAEKKLNDTLLNSIISSGDWEKLMQEDPIILEKRTKCMKAVEVLRESQKEIEQVDI